MFNIVSSPEILLFLFSILRTGIRESVAGLTGESGVDAVSTFVKSISILSALAAFCLSAVISITSILFLMGCNFAAAAFGSFLLSCL